MTLATYHGTYGATKIQHMCELCGNYIQHDYHLIQRHFSCTHKHLTVKEYFLKYVYKSQSVPVLDFNQMERSSCVFQESLLEVSESLIQRILRTHSL